VCCYENRLTKFVSVIYMVMNVCCVKIHIVNNVVPLAFAMFLLLAEMSFVPFSYKINYTQHIVESVSVCCPSHLISWSVHFLQLCTTLYNVQCVALSKFQIHHSLYFLIFPPSISVTLCDLL
jgi:hypothetical protein